MMVPPPSAPDPNETRKRWIAVLARAEAGAIAAHLARAPQLPGFVALRAPESGLVMLRGRAGGEGAAFNLGEATVTRCSIRDAQGRTGHAYVLGRDKRHAELAARLDAVLQDAILHDRYHEAVIAPLASAQAASRDAIAARAAATDVQFFTLATMRS